ncbi:MAG: CDP-alcohol phosphatidyltransferase family protein [Gammaproteobacteria bacterium]|nr:CDP-alcohol phosphatidyltransferase family protein [Gammaproteobacteria bacterium]MDH5592820.1 CDP-alcohol phosphatidyltransferase family protein [Gammaproteobacteria bacterium]MDH5613863.1 CDP-alcohol phosphatidyltransferase family protein [Gammaproteobacteria bacterium]
MLREIPNIISVARIILVVPIVYTLIKGMYDTALFLFVIAGISDGLDGFLAKHFGWVTRLGGILDPLADKILLISCYVVLGWQEVIPVWLVAAVIIRDVIIVTGGIVYHFRIEVLEALPSVISKINTFMQIVVVVAVMLDRSWWDMPPIMLDTLFYITLATTIASGLDYVWRWSARAMQITKGKG